MKIEHIVFENRYDAFEQLCNVLPISDMKQEEWIILAISSGAVPIALNLTRKLDGKFDFLFTKKIYTKKNSECEIAIVTETNEIIIHEELMKSFNLDLKVIYRNSEEKYLKDIKKYKALYRNNLDIIDFENKNVLLVDEGLNTGLTMMACIKSVIAKKAKSICVAVPVLPKVTIDDIESIADDLYYIQAPAHFLSIDFYYKELKEIKLKEIEKLKENYKKENNVNNM
ncbi:MAG: phosphoribosyltransferase family protein [Campylobacterota bacterium]|nr:phosphoribosyltransferase family protein [Campylobacterota bacterium]